MMAGSASGREQLEKRSAEVLCPADASVPGSVAVDEIVEKLSRVNRGGSISDLPADMSHIQIQDFGHFSKLIWGDDRPALIHCSSCGAVDFQASSHAILKSPSLAFLHSVWRTKTMLLDKKDSCLPRISKLFDTTSDYKHIRKMLGEDRACADSSSDHVAARVERPEASYISGSQFFQVGKVNVQSWACVSFSCLSLKEIIMVLSELRELMAPGMDISPEPTLFIHATAYSHDTDIKQGLLSARKFFCKQSNAEAKLLVILHDAEYSDGYLDELCKDIEVYQSCRCSPKPHKGDLKNVASEIMLKVLDFKARKSSVYGSSELEEFGELFRGEDTDGSYNNKNDIGAEEISEDKPSEKQQLHVEKSSTKKRKHADCDEHGAELIRDEEPQDANKDSSRSLELIWNDFIFTPSIQCTCGFHFRAPPSSAFLLSVWRTEAETKLLDKKDSCLPMIDRLKLFDTTGDYKFIGKMPAEDRACPDSSSDHAAAHVESRNSTANNSSEGRKRPEASHISGSQVRVMSKESFAKGFATINYDNLEFRKVDVRSWACVSFSHKSVEEIFTGLSELTELMATGMDISLEPSLFINATYPDYTDMEQAMVSAREFFCEQSKTEAKLLLILHDAEYSDGNFDEFCEEFGVTYQYCCSQRLNKKYLMDVASEIMFKVLNFTVLNFSVDRWDELMEGHASSLESYKKLFRDEDTDGSHNNKIDIGNEEISEGKPSEKQQLHVEKSFSKKRKHVDCEDLQEVEPMDEEPPVANKISERRQRKGNRAEKGNRGEERGRGGGHTDLGARLREETGVGEEHKPSLRWGGTADASRRGGAASPAGRSRSCVAGGEEPEPEPRRRRGGAGAASRARRSSSRGRGGAAAASPAGRSSSRVAGGEDLQPRRRRGCGRSTSCAGGDEHEQARTFSPPFPSYPSPARRFFPRVKLSARALFPRRQNFVHARPGRHYSARARPRQPPKSIPRRLGLLGVAESPPNRAWAPPSRSARLEGRLPP